MASSSSSLIVLPRPGNRGAKGAHAYAGRRFVLTGAFPEVGGGAGGGVGRERVKALIESFGGGVEEGAVSSTTDFVIVGKAPGVDKVAAARERGIPTPDIRGLVNALFFTDEDLEDQPAAVIQSEAEARVSLLRVKAAQADLTAARAHEAAARAHVAKK